MYKQFGKHSGPLLKQKASFFEENNKHVQRQRKIAEIYKQQSFRLSCKNCDLVLKDEVDFEKDKIGYKICSRCGHLNGIYEDSEEYCDFVYDGDSGEEYALNYEVEGSSSFAYRLSSIYSPKAEFLYSSLLNCGESPHQLSYLDFGCGSGYFVGALQNMELEHIRGSEVSSYQVEFGNRMLGRELLDSHRLDETLDVLKTTDANVVSLIGVLEHVSNPRAVINELKCNRNVDYIYLSVPIYSLSVFIEIMNDDLFHRHLHGSHTHLYTKQSLHYLAEEFDFSVSSEWWFGSDIVDFYRSIFVSLESKKVSQFFKDDLQAMMIPLIDKLQLEIDKSELSSEVHILLQRKK